MQPLQISLVKLAGARADKKLNQMMALSAAPALRIADGGVMPVAKELMHTAQNGMSYYQAVDCLSCCGSRADRPTQRLCESSCVSLPSNRPSIASVLYYLGYPIIMTHS